MYRSVYWADYATATYAADHLLAAYDVVTDELVELVPETRCPAPGNLTHQDEAGNIYFSNWIWPVAGELMRDAPESCVLRVAPGSDTFDPTWSFSYEALSGHPGAMFTYTGDGQGLVAIFDETQVSIEPDADPWALAGSPVWTIWDVDLDAVTGAPIEGIPPNSGAYTPVTFADRRFLLVPSDDWARTDLYELTESGAVPGLHIPGFSYAFVQVRRSGARAPHAAAPLARALHRRLPVRRGLDRGDHLLGPRARWLAQPGVLRRGERRDRCGAGA